MSASTPPLDDLTVYCVSQVLAAREECTFERLVYECFTRFPEAFGLNRYPQWPDSARVNKSWLRCRTDKGWIVGSVQEGFRLTAAGEVAAKRLGHRLGAGGGPRQSSARARERFESMLRSLRADALFRSHAPGKPLDASDMQLRTLLGATLETPVRVLRQNIRAYQGAAEAYRDREVLDFLAECERIVASRDRGEE